MPGEESMRKTIHFEKIPVAVAEKILEKQNSHAKYNGNGNGKRMVKKSGKAPTRPRLHAKKDEVLLS
jgi:hypothetical protein